MAAALQQVFKLKDTLRLRIAEEWRLKVVILTRVLTVLRTTAFQSRSIRRELAKVEAEFEEVPLMTVYYLLWR